MSIDWERIQAERSLFRNYAKYVGPCSPPDAESLLKLRPLLTEKQFLYFCLSARGMTGEAIAGVFGVNPSSVSRGIARAKRRLAAAIAAGEIFYRDDKPYGLNPES